MNNLYANPQIIETNELSPAVQLHRRAIAPISSVVDIPEIQIWKSAKNVRENYYLSYDELVKLIMVSDTNPILIRMRQSYEQFVKTGDISFKNEYDSLKPMLPLITFTSHLKDYRSEINLCHYTGDIPLDIDFKDNPGLKDNFGVLKRNISDDLYTNMCFTSPKGIGYGMKIVVRIYLNKRIIFINNELKRVDLDLKTRQELIDEIKSFHMESYKVARNYYRDKYGIVFDSNAEAMQGCCFLSADKDIYYNPNSSSFKIIWAYLKKQKPVYSSNINSNSNFSSSSEILEAILKDFTKNCNGRNTATYTIAMQAKHYNIGEDEILSFVMSKWGDSDFTDKEALRAIRNGFKYNPFTQYIFNSDNTNNK